MGFIVNYPGRSVRQWYLANMSQDLLYSSNEVS